jgi:hypothetical protein
MVKMENGRPSKKSWTLPWWIACAGFLAIAILMSWQEHKAHILGAFPYLFLLACPLMHFLMHRGHQGHGHHESSESDLQREARR